VPPLHQTYLKPSVNLKITLLTFGGIGDIKKLS